MQMSLWVLYQSMAGFAKGIVYTLALMSLYSLTIMFQKWWYLRAAQVEIPQRLEACKLLEARVRQLRAHCELLQGR